MAAKLMKSFKVKVLKTALIVSVLGGLYFLTLAKHAERDARRQAEVQLTPACAAKLEGYTLRPDALYRSPYLVKTTGRSSDLRGYSEEDVRAVQRGCNIIDDTQGQLAKEGARERWNATRYSRSTHASCDHCHQGVGDK